MISLIRFYHLSLLYTEI